MATPFARTHNALARETPRLALFALAVAAALLAVWLLWFTLASVTLYEVSTSARLEVGTVPRAVSPAQSGRMIATRLSIGRRVTAGDALVSLDAEPQRLRLAEAERRMLDYPRRLASLDREMALLGEADSADRSSAAAATRAARARATEADAASRLAADIARRHVEDSEAGGVSQADAIRTRADARRAAASRDALAEDARRIATEAQSRGGRNSAHREELERMRLALADDLASTAALATQLRIEIAGRVVRAPVSGVVADVQAVAPGAIVVAGQRLATILPAGDLIVVAAFDPANGLGRIRPGQRATLRLAGYPWTEYGVVPARVERVAGELRDGRMRVELSAARGAIRGVALVHGLAGSVEVAVEHVSPARLLMRTAGGALR